jgi:hypothetical protein
MGTAARAQQHGAREWRMRAFTGRVAVVTGAASGIGRAMAAP